MSEQNDLGHNGRGGIPILTKQWSINEQSEVPEALAHLVSTALSFINFLRQVTNVKHIQECLLYTKKYQNIPRKFKDQTLPLDNMENPFESWRPFLVIVWTPRDSQSVSWGTHRNTFKSVKALSSGPLGQYVSRLSSGSACYKVSRCQWLWLWMVSASRLGKTGDPMDAVQHPSIV